MTDKTCAIIIEGVTEDGKAFRPSDWIERISGSFSTFGSDRRVRYSPYLQPEMREGRKRLIVDPRLREADAMGFEFLIEFARANRLRIRDACGVLKEGETETELVWARSSAA